MKQQTLIKNNLNEATIDELSKNDVSNLTWNFLSDRYENGNSKIELTTATYHINNDFLEVTFLANATYGRTKYTLVFRFYNVEQYFISDPAKSRYSKVESMLRNIIHKCDVKLYSNDPSFMYQGSFEGLAKNNMSIFKFPGPNGDHVWDERHSDSGGLINSEIHLTKHLAQVVTTMDKYISRMAQILNVTE